MVSASLLLLLIVSMFRSLYSIYYIQYLWFANNDSKECNLRGRSPLSKKLTFLRWGDSQVAVRTRSKRLHITSAARGAKMARVGLALLKIEHSIVYQSTRSDSDLGWSKIKRDLTPERQNQFPNIEIKHSTTLQLQQGTLCQRQI